MAVHRQGRQADFASSGRAVAEDIEIFGVCLDQSQVHAHKEEIILQELGGGILNLGRRYEIESPSAIV